MGPTQLEIAVFQRSDLYTIIESLPVSTTYKNTGNVRSVFGVFHRRGKLLWSLLFHD